MVTDALLGIFFGLVNTLLTPLGFLSGVFNFNKATPILQYFRMAGYILPMEQLMPIVAFFIGLMAFRVIIALVKTIWSLLPIL